MSQSGEGEGQTNDGGLEDEYVLNPLAQLEVDEGDAAGSRKIRVTTCRRGSGRQTTEVNARERPRLASILEQLIQAPGDVELELSDEDEAAVRAIGLFVRPRDIPKRVQFELPSESISAMALAEATRTAARESFRERGYAVVPRLVSDAQLTALQLYYRAMVEEGWTRFSDAQVERRYSLHNDRVSRMFLNALTPVVAEVVGTSIKPSYAFFASYRQGAILHNHRDRPQCEFSISFLVDYAPQPVEASPWPLWVRHQRDEVGVPLVQRIGDGIFYKGCELYHSRTALPDGHRSTHIFFHYVPADFVGPLD